MQGHRAGGGHPVQAAPAGLGLDRDGTGPGDPAGAADQGHAGLGELGRGRGVVEVPGDLVPAGDGVLPRLAAAGGLEQ